MTSIAIIGAGLAGITLARELRGVAEVTVFEKSRGYGGRMATRHAEPYQFDHGAQFFTARSAEFKQVLQEVQVQSAMVLWEPKIITLQAGQKPFKRDWFEPHYVGVPGMNALCKALAGDCNVQLRSEVSRIMREGAGWRLTGADEFSYGVFDWVISAVPSPQALTLMPADFAFREAMDAVNFSPCFALMLGLSTQPPLNFDAAVVRDSPIGWIAVESSKSGRADAFSLLIHSDNDWAQSHIDSNPEEVTELLISALHEVTGISSKQIEHKVLHRWRYARAESFAGEDYLLDGSNHLAACGDWCQGGRVEDAFLSGARLGLKLKSLLRFSTS